MIRLLNLAEVSALDSHLANHWNENEAEGFMVPQPLSVLLGAFDETLWTNETSAGLWQRVWGDFSGSRIVAHTVLTGNPFAPHRCILGLGVERAFRRHGIGQNLMQAAFDWAATQKSIDWIDGQALGNNAPVLTLDYSMGFERVGTIPDVVRRDGLCISQIQLAYRVRH